jgi:NAD(P)-dependent dehydrogenase (short-subunit alcohol dehydrogenase family)
MIFSQMTERRIQYMLSKIPMNRFGDVKEVAEMVSWPASTRRTFSTAVVFGLSSGPTTY